MQWVKATVPKSKTSDTKDISAPKPNMAFIEAFISSWWKTNFCIIEKKEFFTNVIG